jgi:hypothetical protein
MMHNPTASLFDDLIESIKQEYERTNYGCGWKFLYTPKSTFVCPNDLMWIGVNPGGSEDCRGSSVEAGSAYRVEIEE